MYIYITTNKINGKKYVGKCQRTVEKSEHYLGSGNLLKHSIKKYGKDNFIKEILEKNLNLSNIQDRERYWIKILDTKFPKGYNLTDGGEGLLNPTDETRKRMSEKNKKLSGVNSPKYGKPVSEETKKKISEKLKNRYRSPETIEKHKQKMLGRITSKETKKKMSDSKKGKKHTPTQIEKRRQKLIGKPLSKEHKEKIGKSNKGKKVTEEQKEKSRNSNPKTTKIKQIDFITKELICIFPSMNEASRKTGIDLGGISCAINGKYKQFKGFIWEKTK
jgi:group I intron endonuclease